MFYLIQSKIFDRYKFSFSAVSKTDVEKKKGWCLKKSTQEKLLYQKQYPSNNIERESQSLV